MKIYATYGLIGALCWSLLTLACFFFGLHGEQIHLLNNWRVSLPLKLLEYVFSLVVLVLGIRAWRDEAGDMGMSYGRGIGVGMFIGLWQTLGKVAFLLVYVLVINPGYIDGMVTNMLAQMQAKGGPAETFAMTEKWISLIKNPFLWGLGLVPGTLFYSLIVSLVAAAILKREPPAPAYSEPPAMPPLAG